MAGKKVDGVIEAVHYGSDRELKWARAYLRRGATYTDRVLVDRQALINQLKSGKRLFTGSRIPLQASTFTIRDQLRLVHIDGQDILLSGDAAHGQDYLEETPII